MAFWGQMIPIYAVLLQSFDPITLSLLRYIIGAPIIVLLAIAWRALLPLPDLSDTLRLIFLAWFGMAGLVILSTVGLALSDPVTAIFVTAAAPLIHTLIAVMAYGERMLKGSILALALAIAGMFLISLDSGGVSNAGFRGGEILLLGASVCWAWYSLQARRWFPRTSSLRLTTYSMVACLPFLFLVWFFAFSFELLQVPDSAPSSVSLFFLFWVVITGTCIGVMLWHGAMYVLGGAVMAIYLALAPLFGVAIGLFFGFFPSILQIFGGFLIIVAVLRVRAAS